MTGFKLTSFWSSKADHHESDSIKDSTEIKTKKSFFGFSTNRDEKKGSKKNVESAKTISKLDEIDSKRAQSGNVLTVEPKSKEVKGMAFTNNPLKRSKPQTNASSVERPPEVSNVAGMPAICCNSNEVTSAVKSNKRLPDGRSNPLSLSTKRDSLLKKPQKENNPIVNSIDLLASQNFHSSPTKPASPQTAVVNQSHPPPVHSISFKDLSKEYDACSSLSNSDSSEKKESESTIESNAGFAIMNGRFVMLSTDESEEDSVPTVEREPVTTPVVKSNGATSKEFAILSIHDIDKLLASRKEAATPTTPVDSVVANASLLKPSDTLALPDVERPDLLPTKSDFIDPSVVSNNPEMSLPPKKELISNSPTILSSKTTSTSSTNIPGAAAKITDDQLSPTSDLEKLNADPPAQKVVLDHSDQRDQIVASSANDRISPKELELRSNPIDDNTRNGEPCAENPAPPVITGRETNSSIEELHSSLVIPDSGMKNMDALTVPTVSEYDHHSSETIATASVNNSQSNLFNDKSNVIERQDEEIPPLAAISELGPNQHINNPDQASKLVEASAEDANHSDLQRNECQVPASIIPVSPKIEEEKDMEISFSSPFPAIKSKFTPTKLPSPLQSLSAQKNNSSPTNHGNKKQESTQQSPLSVQSNNTKVLLSSPTQESQQQSPLSASHGTKQQLPTSLIRGSKSRSSPSPSQEHEEQQSFQTEVDNYPDVENDYNESIISSLSSDSLPFTSNSDTGIPVMSSITESSDKPRGSISIPYVALREKPPPTVNRSRTSRSSRENSIDALSLESEESSKKGNRSFDEGDVHVDLTNIYEEPPTVFLSNCMSGPHSSSRTTSNADQDDSLPPSPVNLQSSSAPKVFSLPYLSAKGLVKAFDSTDELGSRSRSTDAHGTNKALSVSASTRRKSLDDFFDNPFGSNKNLSSKSAESDKSYDQCELEISDCTEAIPIVIEVDDNCNYEYKDIMNLDSVDDIDFVANPLRHPTGSEVQEGTATNPNQGEELASIHPGHEVGSPSTWNWRSIVAGTSSPSLAMIAPSLVKPDGRRRNPSRFSFSQMSASNDGDRSIIPEQPKNDIDRLIPDQVAATNDMAALTKPVDTCSSPCGSPIKSPLKSHRRSGEMVNLESCLAVLLEPSADGKKTKPTDKDGEYAVPSICKISRDLKKFQQPIIVDTADEENSIMKPSNSSIEDSLQEMRQRAAEVSDCRNKAAANNTIHARKHMLKSTNSGHSTSVPSAKSFNYADQVASPLPAKQLRSKSSTVAATVAESTTSKPPRAPAIGASNNKTIGDAKQFKTTKDPAIEAIDKAMKSASSTAANINRLCNLLQPQQKLPQQQRSSGATPKSPKLSPLTVSTNPSAHPVPIPTPTTPQSSGTSLKEKLSSPSVNPRLDLLMGRIEKEKDQAKKPIRKSDIISSKSKDVELLEKTKVTLSESLVSFDRNVVKEAQRRKLTLASKLDLQLLKAAVESANRLDILLAKSKKANALTAEEKKELKTLTQEKVLLDRVHDFANCERSSRKYSSVERAELQPLKQELERKVKFTRLYRKHKANEPFSFEEKAEYILLKESLEAEKRFEQLLRKFHTTADELEDKENRKGAKKTDVTVLERVELIILKIEQEKQQRYEILLAKEKTAGNQKMSLAEKSELAILRKEVELQLKQHQERVIQLAHQLRQGYTYTASMDPFAAAVSATRSTEAALVAMTDRALTISMDEYDIRANQQKEFNQNDAETDCTSHTPTAGQNPQLFDGLSSQQTTYDITSTSSVDSTTAGNATTSTTTTVITIIIKDASKKDINISEVSSDEDSSIKLDGKDTFKSSRSSSTDSLRSKSAKPLEMSPVAQNLSFSTPSEKQVSSPLVKGKSAKGNPGDAGMLAKQKTTSTQDLERKKKAPQFAKLAEEKLKQQFAEKEQELAREKQRKLEEFLQRSHSSDRGSKDKNDDIFLRQQVQTNATAADATATASATTSAASLSETYDSYPHFSITQKAELNLLKLEGEKRRRLEEEKQKRLAQFLGRDEASDSDSGGGSTGIMPGTVSNRRKAVEQFSNNESVPNGLVSSRRSAVEKNQSVQKDSAAIKAVPRAAQNDVKDPTTVQQKIEKPALKASATVESDDVKNNNRGTSIPSSVPEKLSATANWNAPTTNKRGPTDSTDSRKEVNNNSMKDASASTIVAAMNKKSAKTDDASSTIPVSDKAKPDAITTAPFGKAAFAVAKSNSDANNSNSFPPGRTVNEANPSKNFVPNKVNNDNNKALNEPAKNNNSARGNVGSTSNNVSSVVAAAINNLNKSSTSNTSSNSAKSSSASTNSVKEIANKFAKTATAPHAQVESDLGLDKVAVKPLRPAVLKRINSGYNSDGNQESSNVNTITFAEEKPPIIIRKSSKQSVVDSEASCDNQESSKHFRSFSNLSSNSNGSLHNASLSPSNNSASNRKQPAIVQIFEQAKEMHRKAEMERIEKMKNDPSRKIVDPPFSLILGSAASISSDVDRSKTTSEINN